MNRRVFYFSVLSLTISACSSVDNKRALGDFDYADKQNAKPLIIPETLDKPAEQTEFKIADNINQAGPIGVAMDIRAPSLVLPVAASSRVVPESNDAIIWFDKVLEEEELLSFIEKAVVEQLDSDQVTYTVIKEHQEFIADGKSKKPSKITVYESDWYHNEVESGWLWSSVDSATSMRFRYEFLAKPHGRSVSLKVSLIDYMRTDSKGASKEIDPIDKQRAEMAMLNEIISQVDYDYRLKQRENRLMRANQKLVSIGENVEAEAAYIVEMGLDDLWANMPIFFEKHGFTISDLNESKKIYYVDFVKPDVSLWDSIWGDDVPVLDVRDAQYQFVLAAVGDNNDQTSVTIYDADGEPLSAETLERVFPVIEAGLSFRNIY